MNRELIEALHSEVRRYCEENAAIHSERYSLMTRMGRGYNFGTRTYSNEARDVFPRYLQLYAMLSAVEVFVPEDFATLEEARARLARAIESAEIDNPATTSDPISAASIEEERALLLAHLRDVDEDWLWRVTPLPRRRVMPKPESDALLATVEARFGRWYGGMTSSPRPPPHLTFVISALEDPTRTIRRLIAPLTSRVFHLPEISSSMELDLEAEQFNAAESYWVPADTTWMIHRSHEGTVTFAGERLLEAVNASAADWPVSARRG